MKKKRLLGVFLILIFFAGFLFVKADSGWDTDYDSGGSWDSGWDSDWSSDWDSDYGDGEGGVAFLIFAIVFITIIFIMIKSNSSSSNEKDKDYDIENDEDVVVDLPDFNKDAFLVDCYDNFIKLQNAWSDFDYDTMKTLISDELFNNYKSQLKVLSAKKQKNIMHDFELIDAYISNFEKDGKYYSIDVIMTVSFYDYVVNKDGKVVRGKKKTLVENKYLLTYSKDERHSNICPNCGATLKKEDVTKCEYCKTIISNNNHDWILVKKQIKK